MQNQLDQLKSNVDQHILGHYNDVSNTYDYIDMHGMTKLLCLRSLTSKLHDIQ